MDDLTLVEFDESFLDLSWQWLNDPQIKELTLSPNFTREQQYVFFESIKDRKDYLIFGLMYNKQQKIGVVGLKNINKNRAEYWGYIGDKDYWGKGLGFQLIRLIEGICKDIGVNKLYLNVSVDNIRAIKSYLKSGFEKGNIEHNIMYMEKINYADTCDSN